MKRFTAISLLLIIIILMCSCNSDKTNHKTGWQNPEEPTTGFSEETTASEEETSEENKDIPANTDSETKITFSEAKALLAGSFDSAIYGKLTVYFQDGYFLIFDEFKDRKFTVFAENYSADKTEGKPVAIFDDMNFDGHNDFGVCYYKDALNSYYFCFLWNQTQKTFTYYLPLSALANPEFNDETKSITAFEKLTTTRTLKKTFVYSGAELSQVSAKEVTEEIENKGAETVEADTRITQNGKTALIELHANKNTHSKWICDVEDENIVISGSEYYDTQTDTYEFILSGISPGATTVIFRYVSLYTEEYIEEVIINAIVKEDMSLEIVVPE